jgi:hypothetical protein
MAEGNGGGGEDLAAASKELRARLVWVRDYL